MTNNISDNLLEKQLELRKKELEKTRRAIMKAKKQSPRVNGKPARSKAAYSHKMGKLSTCKAADIRLQYILRIGTELYLLVPPPLR